MNEKGLKQGKSGKDRVYIGPRIEGWQKKKLVQLSLKRGVTMNYLIREMLTEKLGGNNV